MNHNEFNHFCRDLPATTHVVQWGNSDVWKVGGKVFAIGGSNKAGILGFTFKTSELNFEFLREREGFRPAPYLASRGFKWIQYYTTHDILNVDSETPRDLILCKGDLSEELNYYITESHRLVHQGLSKKKQKELGLL